jgi:ferredoxin
LVILIGYNYNLKGSIKQNWKPECGTSLEEYSAARKSHYHIAESNSNLQLQGRTLFKYAAINAFLDLSKPPKRKEAYMAATSAQILGWWSAAVGCVGCIAAVIVCKDVGSRRSRLVNELATGKTASESAHRLLSGVPLMWGRGFWETKGNVKSYAPVYEQAKHVLQKEKGSEAGEDTTILKNDTKKAAVFEAERCLGCGRPFDANQTCWYCLPCEIECPTNAIEVQIPYLLR